MIYYNKGLFFFILICIIIIGFIGAIIKMVELWTFSFGLLLGMIIDSLMIKEEIGGMK